MWYNGYMATLYFILLLAGAVCFLAATVGRGVAAGARTDGVARGGVGALALLPLGLLFWILVPLIQFGRVVF